MASSFPQSYSSNIFPNDLRNFPVLPVAEGHCCCASSLEVVPFFDNGGVLDRAVQPEFGIAPSMSVSVASIVPDMAAPALPGYCKGLSGIGTRSQRYGEECGGYMMGLHPIYQPSFSGAFGVQGNYLAAAAAAKEPNVKVVGRYSEEERRDRILRYLKKRNQRNFNKTVKYACRKILADRRVRVRGRFARNNNEIPDHEMVINKNCSLHQTKDQLFFGGSIQFEHDEEEEWLREAVASLADFTRDC